MLFGADRVSGKPVHPVIAAHREQVSGGRALADWIASHGYAVIVIDAYHFGRRAPRGMNGLPASYDPARLDEATLKDYDARAKDREQLYYGVRELNWAGTTWAGVNYGDDSRCIDYLLTRKEVDPERIGCTGLSGGGWRTNMMAALEPRIKAAVSVGWMTTGDAQQSPPPVGRSIMDILASERQGTVDATRDRAFAARERHSHARYNNLGYPQRALRVKDYLYIRNFAPKRWPVGAPQALDAQGHVAPMHAAYFDLDRSPTLAFLVQNRNHPRFGNYFLRAVGKRPEEELFDVRKDPGCLHNLAADVAFDTIRRELSTALETELRRTGLSSNSFRENAPTRAFQINTPQTKWRNGPDSRSSLVGKVLAF